METLTAERTASRAKEAGDDLDVDRKEDSNSVSPQQLREVEPDPFHSKASSTARAEAAITGALAEPYYEVKAARAALECKKGILPSS